MTTVHLGVVGLGNMGSVHAHTVPELKGVKLAAVCDLVKEKLEQFPGVEKYVSSEEMIASGRIEAVVIATPHYSHTTIGMDALDSGLHVLVEKPISVHKADCERLIAAHAGEAQVFAAMFNQRTDPHYIRIRNLVQSGELGAVQRVNWIITNWFRTESYYASGGWRATWGGEGGGVLLNQCPHNLDLLQWIVGMPNKVRAFAGFGKYHQIEVEDEVTAFLEWPNGATGVFVTTTGEAPGTNRLEIVGDRGKLVYEEGEIRFTRTEFSVKEFRETSPESFPTVPTWECQIEVDGNGGQHRAVLQNFIEAIQGGKPLVAPAREGIHSVELANAMLLSAWTDTTVTVPLDGALYERELQVRIASSKFQKGQARQSVVNMEGSYR